MTAILKDIGCCPICDRQVPRLLARESSATREVYTCPTDGSVTYGPQAVSLRHWIDERRKGSVALSASYAFDA